MAVIASNSKVGHVLGSFHCNGLTFVIFLSLNDVTWHQLHDVAALATHEVLVQLTDLHSLCLFDLLQLLWA